MAGKRKLNSEDACRKFSEFSIFNICNTLHPVGGVGMKHLGDN
jgi:hypothetical protein